MNRNKDWWCSDRNEVAKLWYCFEGCDAGTFVEHAS